VPARRPECLGGGFRVGWKSTSGLRFSCKIPVQVVYIYGPTPDGGSRAPLSIPFYLSRLPVTLTTGPTGPAGCRWPVGSGAGGESGVGDSTPPTTQDGTPSRCQVFRSTKHNNHLLDKPPRSRTVAVKYLTQRTNNGHPCIWNRKPDSTGHLLIHRSTGSSSRSNWELVRGSA
jgi:hypothetical protein